MPIEAYVRKMDNQTVYLIGPELPHGFKLADPIHPVVVVYGDTVTTEWISTSDDFWGEAEEAGQIQKNEAISTAGGRKKVEQMFEIMKKEWKAITTT